MVWDGWQICSVEAKGKFTVEEAEAAAAVWRALLQRVALRQVPRVVHLAGFQPEFPVPQQLAELSSRDRRVAALQTPGGLCIFPQQEAR